MKNKAVHADCPPYYKSTAYFRTDNIIFKTVL
jgi:hypothetical protein